MGSTDVVYIASVCLSREIADEYSESLMLTDVLSYICLTGLEFNIPINVINLQGEQMN